MNRITSPLVAYSSSSSSSSTEEDEAAPSDTCDHLDRIRSLEATQKGVWFCLNAQLKRIHKLEAQQGAVDMWINIIGLVSVAILFASGVAHVHQ